eukprot:m.137087 g.137087  ORF g.137087 m.137087 type:complete len:376 (+) comp15884_c0_seq7:125-1252(+)
MEAFDNVLTSMFVEENRLASFEGSNWPFTKRRKCRPENLAKAGFVYKGTAEAPDLVQCFLCQKELDGWEAGDDPMKEHEVHSPRCPFVTLSLEESRVATFALWPKHLYKATPEDFAKAGFVYLPCKDSPDQLTCFKCKKSLDGWEENDDPFEEHYNHNKRCTYIKVVMKLREEAAKSVNKGDVSKQSSDGKNSESDSMENEPEVDRSQSTSSSDCSCDTTQHENTTAPTRQTHASDDVSVTETEAGDENQINEDDAGDEEEEPSTTVKKPIAASKRIAVEQNSPVKKHKNVALSDRTNMTPTPTSSSSSSSANCKEMQVDPLADPEIQQKTVKEYLEEIKDTMLHKIVAEAEEKIQVFRAKAAETRKQIEALYNA